MASRKRNMVLRVDDEELAMAHALAAAEDEPVARLVRRFIREAYGARFGTAKPPTPTLKHGAEGKAATNATSSPVPTQGREVK